MADRYILGIDQSTQGTKAVLMDARGRIAARAYAPHEQLVNERGWVSHSPEEIYQNVIKTAREAIIKSGADRSGIAAIGISNQRETTVIWDRESGRPLADAIVWQCARAAEICERETIRNAAERIRTTTGIPLSPYFPAAKLAWLFENVPGAKEKAAARTLCCGTVDSWLVFKLTGGRVYKTDRSNASRTQLFDIVNLKWDEEICRLFGVDSAVLPEVCDSCGIPARAAGMDCVYGSGVLDSPGEAVRAAGSGSVDSSGSVDGFGSADGSGSTDGFGSTNLEGFLDREVPILCVMGDSHAALFGQGCLKPGMIKATYGTGSSIMMNIGEKPVISSHGIVTSLAWGINGSVNYVLEGNLNYTGAVISWLKDGLKLIAEPAETESLAWEAARDDSIYLVPAFSGLGAPYWDSHAQAAIIGMTRTTGRAEVARAALECIAYQITDIVKAMEMDAGIRVSQLRVDGGPARNRYLMQFQSDILGAEILAPEAEELSAIGVCRGAGLACGLYDESIFAEPDRKSYQPEMDPVRAAEKYAGWQRAVQRVLS